MDHPVHVDWDSIASCQKFITEWADGAFPNRTAHQALSKLVLEEIPEMLHALKPLEAGTDPFNRHNLEEEFADTLILLFDLASLWGVNIQGGLYRKMSRNIKRKWVLDSAGIAHHVKEKKDEAE